MHFKFFILGGLIGLNLVFGQNQNIVTLPYTGSKEDLKKIEQALIAGKEVCFNATIVPINLKIDNCKVSKEENSKLSNIRKVVENLEKIPAKIPNKICKEDNNNEFCINKKIANFCNSLNIILINLDNFTKFCNSFTKDITNVCPWKIITNFCDSIADFFHNSTVNKIADVCDFPWVVMCSFLKRISFSSNFIPNFLCDSVTGGCNILNSCTFSWSSHFSVDKPFVFVGRMSSNFNCFSFNFDFSTATQMGMFILDNDLDNDNVTVNTNLSFNITGNNKLYFYWHIQNNWSGSGNVNVNFKNLAGFYFSAASITGSTNFTFNGSRLKNFSFFVNQKLTGSGKISLNLNSYINLVSIDIPEIDSKQLEVSLKKAKKVIISVKNLTNSSKVCIKVKSCPGVMLWLEY